MQASDLHSGDLLYWRGRGVWAWLVRTFTRSDYSHVAVFWLNGSQPTFIDSTPKAGVRATSLCFDPPQWAQKTHTAWTPAIQLAVLKKEFTPYSFVDAFLSFCGLPARARGYMCAELAVFILEQGGWNFKGVNPTPVGLAKAVERATQYTVVPFQ